MSITDQNRVRKVLADATKELAQSKEQFQYEMMEIEKERAVILKEAHRALEEHAIKKISAEIQNDGK